MIKRFKRILIGIKKNQLGKSMFLSTVYKPLGMVISLIYTPLLLSYLGNEKYGLWVTILSIVNWINFFDIGIGNGLRNSLAKALAKRDYRTAKRSVSTAYVVITIIAILACVIGLLGINSFNTFLFFNTKINIKPALIISFIFICINFVLSLCKTQLFALQKAEKVGLMAVLVQLINLVGITFLSIVNNGNIIAIAILVGFSSVIVNIGITLATWRRNEYLIPRPSLYNKKELSEICNVGLKFFGIQIAALVLYTTDNLIISRLYGPTHVTPYATAYSAFGIVNSLFSAMLIPLWSKFTVVVVKRDYRWIRQTILNLDKLLIPISIILLIGSFFFKEISAIWLRKQLAYDPGLILCMAIYYILSIWGSIYATAMNGMGIINLQLILAIFTAILNIPLAIFFGKNMGMQTTGVALSTIVCMLFVNILTTIYLHKFLNTKIQRSCLKN